MPTNVYKVLKVNLGVCVCVCVREEGVGWVRGKFYPSCWFSLNNSETVKAVTLAFYSIQ